MDKFAREAGLGLTFESNKLSDMFGGETVLELMQDGPKEPLVASLGAGAGRFEFLLAQELSRHNKAAKLTLLDKSSRMCQLLKEKSVTFESSIASIDIVESDLLDWMSKNNNKFDCLIVRNITHFFTIKQFNNFLENIKRLIKPQGFCYVMTASTYNSLCLHGKNEEQYGALVQKNVFGGQSIPDNTLMTFVNPEKAKDYFAEKTGLNVFRFDKFKYPLNMQISNKMIGDTPDAVGLFIKK